MTGLSKFMPPMISREFSGGPKDGDSRVSNRGVMYFDSDYTYGVCHEYLLNQEKDVWEWMGLVAIPPSVVLLPLRIGERS